MSGTAVDPAGLEIGKAQGMRMLFMVEVAELGQIQPGNARLKMDFGFENRGRDINSIPIALNYNRYRQYTWSTEEELKEFSNSGLYPVEERGLYRMMLEAFVFHKENLAYLDSLNQNGEHGRPSHRLRI